MKKALAVVVLMSLIIVACGQDEQRYVADCRDAGLRVAAKYGGDEVVNRDIHYNPRSKGCYLSLNYFTREADGPDSTWNLEVQDVNENRTLFACKIPFNTDPFCLDFRKGTEKLSYLDYDRLRKQYMEQ